MTWFLTAGGNEIDLQYVKANNVVLTDIAHSLAQLNRFNGHAKRPYSVAEHSLLVLEIVEQLFAPASVHCRLVALLHDAHEAYVGDLTTPTKQLVGDSWNRLEHRAERSVRSAWALHTAAHVWRDAVKQADLIALATERAQLMPPSATLFPCLVHVQPVTWVDLMSKERVSADWRDWRDRFEDAANILDFERNNGQFKVSKS
jgi:hypothetical protein